MRIIDLTGHKFGLLTVMYPTGEIRSKSRVWVCQCDCGQTNKVTIRGLRTGSVRSCGCLRKSDLIEKNMENSPFSAELRRIPGSAAVTVETRSGYSTMI